MKPFLLLALIPFLFGISCTSTKNETGEPPAVLETKVTTKVTTTARPEDVARVDAFFKEGGKHGFHPPKDQSTKFTAAETLCIVELDQQRVYFYRGNELMAASRISSGRSGYRTETGTYTIGHRNLNHRSNLYGSYVSAGGRTLADDIKVGVDPQPEGSSFVGSLMKYFQRFERNGSPTAMGFHQGVVPSYPASHGCLRLPSKMAAWFFESMPKGTPVHINGTKYGVKPGTRQKGSRRSTRTVTPAKNTPDTPAPAVSTETGAPVTAPTPAETLPSSPANESPAAPPLAPSIDPPASDPPAGEAESASPASPADPAATDAPAAASATELVIPQ
jgi:lipoprotein-anchoring transpeptidase ErfK/SrfK